MNQFKPVARSINFILLLLLLYFMGFGQLGRLPLRIWDEARRGVNAQEMLKSGDWLNIQYAGESDFWGTKPPLLIWMQTLSIAVLGQTEVAVRLPSAIANTAITLLLFFFIRRRWGDSMAMGSCVAYLTTPALLDLHGVRFGDYDTLLTFWIISGMLSFYHFSQTRTMRYWWLSFACFSLALFTKGVAGGLALPGLLIFALFSKSMPRNFLVLLGALVLLLLPVSGYYLIRESLSPGYLAALNQSELSGRLLAITPGHTLNGGDILSGFFNARYYPLWIFSFGGFAWALLQNDSKIKRFAQLSLSMVISHLVIVVAAKSQHFWYDLPTFPIWAVGCGFFFLAVFRAVAAIKDSGIPPLALHAMLLIGVLGIPVQKMLNHTLHPKEQEAWEDFYDLSRFLRQPPEKLPDLQNMQVYSPGYSPHVRFYVNRLSESNPDLVLITDKTMLSFEQPVLTMIHPEEWAADTGLAYEEVLQFRTARIWKPATIKWN
jgi:4-amino-4-deoxy-L-arabinose transferase-like glycosyltransferase